LKEEGNANDIKGKKKKKIDGKIDKYEEELNCTYLKMYVMLYYP
jgi:hypothetical protein